MIDWHYHGALSTDAHGIRSTELRFVAIERVCAFQVAATTGGQFIDGRMSRYARAPAVVHACGNAAAGPRPTSPPMPHRLN